MDAPTLVCAQRWGIPGANYYFANRERWTISLDELADVGIMDEYSYVHPDLIMPLTKVMNTLMHHGYGMTLEDAYRSPETYALVRSKVAAQKGEEFVRRLFSFDTLPHATGRAVDVALVDLKTGKKVWLRNDGRDGIEASFVGFYRDRQDPESRNYQARQDILHDAMREAGFVFGTKLETWHFELPE